MKLASRYNTLSVLLVLLALLANCTSVSAPDYEKVGVKLGNTVDYHTSATFGTHNRTHMLVYGIVGSVVYLNLTDYYPDGTIAGETQKIGDVFIGSNSLFVYLLAANLTAGDPIYKGASMIINETIVMTFAGISRTNNHLRLPDGTFEAYWDKATGLMTKLNLLFLGWINMTIISTDAWFITSPSPCMYVYYVAFATILFVGAIVSAIVGIFLIRRHQRLQGKTGQAQKPIHTKYACMRALLVKSCIAI